MSYRPPLEDIKAALRHAANMGHLARDGLYPETILEMVDHILNAAGVFASQRIAPLNRAGDRIGATFHAGEVVMPPGWRDVYREWTAAGWNGLSAPAAYGGQSLPQLLNAACAEIWHQASMAFALGPLLTAGAIEALARHGSEALKADYLPRLVSGRWMGTMNLTESGAGSDLSGMTTRAEPHSDGTYRLFGQKIFISYGEHDLTDNIIHLVLARLPAGPPGTKGLSLFLVPKYLLDEKGEPANRNDVTCVGIEKKMGLHASPTCVLLFGERGGATGFLVGQEHRGLACMFIMMNAARLGVGLQGVAIAERAAQAALTYAKERRQGRADKDSDQSPIIRHPDVRRMMLEMMSKTAAARAICYLAAEAIDRSHSQDPAAAKIGVGRAALLIPIAKAFATDIGIEVASIGIQVHGGAGFIEETGAAQYLRDARIAAIYEGTNGIQAIDLVTRKLPLEGGKAASRLIMEMRAAVAALSPLMGKTAKNLSAVIDLLDRATVWMIEAAARRPLDALAGATSYLRLFALALGGAALAREAMAERSAPSLRHDKAFFFSSHIASAAGGLANAAMAGVESLGLSAFEETS